MFTLKTTGNNAAASLYAWEIALNCEIALAAYKRLETYARDQKREFLHENEPRPKTVVEVFSDCSVLLNSAAIVSRIVFTGGKGPSRIANQRSKLIRESLKIPALQTLRILRVRNSFEHIDERLDTQLLENESGPFVTYDITHDGDNSGIALKRLNPQTMVLSYLEQSINLSSLNSEIQTIRNNLQENWSALTKSLSINKENF